MDASPTTAFCRNSSGGSKVRSSSSRFSIVLWSLMAISLGASVLHPRAQSPQRVGELGVGRDDLVRVLDVELRARCVRSSERSLGAPGEPRGEVVVDGRDA